MDDDDIPIIGKGPGAIMLWYPTAMIHCQCQSHKMNVVVTTGFNNPSLCGECGTTWLIKGIKTDGTVVVDFITKAEKGQVM